MADKFMPGMQFQDWNSISTSDNPLSESLQGVKQWALGQAVDKSGIRKLLNDITGKKEKETSPTGAVKPTDYSVNADYGMPKMGGQGINPSYINQPNFGQFAVPSASTTAVPPLPQPAGPPLAPTIQDVDKTNDDLWGVKTSLYEPTPDQFEMGNRQMNQMPMQMSQSPVAPPMPGYPPIPEGGGGLQSLLALFA